jgi:hypothetical protein
MAKRAVYTRCMGATHRRSGEDNQAQCEPRWPRTERLHYAHLRRAVPFALAALSERVNIGTLLQAQEAGSRILVIPQLTADSHAARP